MLNDIGGAVGKGRFVQGLNGLIIARSDPSKDFMLGLGMPTKKKVLDRTYIK